MITSPQHLAEHAEALRVKRKSAPLSVLVGMGTCGMAAGATPVKAALEASQGSEKFTISTVGCIGLCHSEPTVEVFNPATGESIIYGQVKPEHAAKIIAAGMTPVEGLKIVAQNWYYPEDEQNRENRPQARIALRNSGRVNPEDLDDYLVRDGYAGMAKALFQMSPNDVVQVVTDSGLRGRGGGGFPTGRKWSIAAAQPGEEKYLICNADEGDPGAFMDRAVLEGDPHAVLEAMVIAGYAIGARNGIIYIRAEYPLAVERLEIAIAQAEKAGLLGKNILGSGFDFSLRIKYGAGAFVCGEETALIRSIAGMRGMPVFKPPFPAVAGLWGKPTIVNNVETFANVPAILRKGADWFKSIGTAGSPGTKVFALAGKINKVGLIEVPMGMTLREIVYGLGQGIADGREYKAAQTGGPSGGCIPKEHLDTPIDYDTLKALGSIMGSGGLIVMDEDDCMVDVAKFFLEFTMDESCGKCTPCRVGGRQMYGILQRITEGNGTMDDLDTLRDLATAIGTASLCGLGMTAPNPVLATLRYFENEYLEHIQNLRCPAGRCSKLVRYTIDEEICTGCTLCARKCPVSCISGSPKVAHVIDQDDCIHCGACYDACKFSAIKKN